jgi:hypothetical protein
VDTLPVAVVVSEGVRVEVADSESTDDIVAVRVEVIVRVDSGESVPVRVEVVVCVERTEDVEEPV